MRWLVCGGRDYADRATLYDYLDGVLRDDPDMVIGSGFDPKDPKYQGADQIAVEWAKERGVPGFCYPAHWKTLGRSAGPRRNERQLERFRPDRLVAAPGNAGTAHMKRIAQAAGVEVLDLASPPHLR